MLGQLLLLRLQLVGQRLRLLEQLFRAHVGGDRVEHDADALGQLVEEGEVGLVVAVERGEFDDRLDLALEEHGQHHDVARLALAQARADRDVVVRHVGEQDALLLERTLPDEAFAKLGIGSTAACARGRRSWPSSLSAGRRRRCRSAM